MNNRALWVLLFSGILGFRVGMLGFPDWQVAVETAQVLGGLVQYPPDNIFYIYHTKLWTSMHHVLALALVAGASELTLSLVVSGVMGMLAFQALALFVYALSRSVLLSIGAAALIILTRAADYGVVYPLFLIGTEHTYGAVGLSFAVLVVAVLGAGWSRSGAFLLGMAPSIHPAIGAWTGAIVALAILSDFRRLRDELQPAFPWFLAGCAVTLLSLLVQFTFVDHASDGTTRLSPQDLATFVRLWDGHRSSIDIRHDGVLLNAATIVLSALWLAFFSSDLSRSAQFLLRISGASALLALALIPASWVPPDRLPTALLVLMPGRYLNFAAMTFAAMVIGLAGSRRDLFSRLVLLLLTCGLLLGDRSMLWDVDEVGRVLDFKTRPTYVMWLAAAALTAGAAMWKWTAIAYARIAYAATIAVLMTVVFMALQARQPRSGAHFNDRTNDVFFADVAAGEGLLLAAGDLHLLQLRTRRPVLVDSGAIDTVMYSLETGAGMQRILRDAYGLDLFNPPPEAIGSGRIPHQAHRQAWERFTPEKWRALREAFGVTQVVAYADWSLQLPVASQSRRLLLYDIPER